MTDTNENPLRHYTVGVAIRNPEVQHVSGSKDPVHHETKDVDVSVEARTAEEAGEVAKGRFDPALCPRVRRVDAGDEVDAPATVAPAAPSAVAPIGEVQATGTVTAPADGEESIEGETQSRRGRPYRRRRRES